MTVRVGIIGAGSVAHGIVALGDDVVNAYNVADLIEELAWIAYLAEGM